MQDIIEFLKNTLHSKDSSECEDTSTNSINSANNTVIDMSNDIKSNLSQLHKDKQHTNEYKEKDTISIDNISNNDIDKAATKLATKSDAENCLSHNMSPKKSSIRNNMLDMKDGNTQKNVRFTDKTEHQDLITSKQ